MFQYEREVWQGRARSETSNGRLARAAYACKYVTDLRDNFVSEH